mmetsp:Transcript_6044/g.555  ORF Transcript_6044/g.555 Transcript_6044/m.555 type:complete len:102 (+) Transcript_6044:604-909(+)
MPNIIDSIFKSHSKNGEKFVFSLCLSNKDGGFMTVGGYNHELHKEEESTFIIPYEQGHLYNVKIHKININGNNIISKTVTYGIDSGTTVLFAPNYIIKGIE